MNAALLLRHDLRSGHEASLARRRAAAALTALSMASLAAVALYQLGCFDHLPEPPLPRLDADRIHGSPEAYRLLHLPDAVLGLGSYAATLALIAFGPAARARTQPWIPLALAGKGVLDAAQAAALTRKSWESYRAFSLYSLVAAGATFLVLPWIIPEAAAAARVLRSNSRR
mgnify:CR=1 FL=1